MQTPSYNQVIGTILAGGTLTAAPFDTQGYTVAGLMAAGTGIIGTMNFRVNGSLDPNSGNWKTLYTGAGIPAAVTAPSGAWAISADALTPLKGFRYFYVVTSAAQTTGLSLTLFLKSE